MFGSFYHRNPKGSDKYLALFYEQMLEISKYKSAYDSYKRDRKYEEAMAIVEKNRDVMRWTKSYEKIRKGMARINRRIGVIYDDDTMTPSEKDKELEKLRQMRLDIAKKVVLTRAQWELARGIEPSRVSLPIGALRANE